MTPEEAIKRLEPLANDDGISEVIGCIRRLSGDLAAVGVRKTGDGAALDFGRNYFTEDITEEGSPVVGCGVIGMELDEMNGPEAEHLSVIVRTADGCEFDTYADFIFADRAKCEAWMADRKARADKQPPPVNEAATNATGGVG